MNKKNIAIVTGASSGFGKEFVKLIYNDDKFDEIWVLARTESKLLDLVSELGEKIKPYIIDLSDCNQIKLFEKYVKEHKPNIKLLINNAGFAKFCSYNDISIDESLNMINLNINGVVSMGLVCIPFMEKDSHIINVASQASFQPVPYLNIYSATKSFVKNYSQALNVELKEKGICVTVVCPGWMKTNFYSRGDVGAKKAPTHFTLMKAPDIVAKKALKDAYNNKDISVCGKFVNFCRFCAKFLPEKWIMRFWLLIQGIK